ncbi:uncharacterized protein LOC130645017 [Hydractinia symbiolongicarpus]|uniref:uncharacterized protein LOC130645017 n=1 Tax=Hydractinia symbiolongicarpus TaxID=13093 RepID=UPI00254D12C8|nr:uncharacterized protein LOC130645017 [Hydractinia symbiolongicarpus]
MLHPIKVVNKIEEEAEHIEMESLEEIDEFVDATESVIQDTSFVGPDEGGITPRERKGLDLELQTLRGNLKSLKNKMILYDSEMNKAEGRVKELEKQKVGADEGQQANLEREIEKAKKEIKDLNDKKKAIGEAHGILSTDIYAQLRHIKDTLLKIAKDNTTLLEKLKILFKEHDITIASIVSAMDY